MLVDIQKHYKIGIAAHFKADHGKITIFKRHYLGQVNGYYLGQVGVNKPTWPRLITIKKLRAHFFFKKDLLKPYL